MKELFAMVLITALTSSGLMARDVVDHSAFIGRWAVDISRLPMPPQQRPKIVTITFADADNKKWTTQVDVVNPDESKSHAEGIFELNGTGAAVQGNFEADTAAITMPTPNVLVMMLTKDGVPGSTRVYAVTADGNSMVETAAYFGQDGKPILRTNYFNRIR